MTDFFRFPHTPHIAWLGEGLPRDDKLLTPHEADELLAADLVVEEKLDGANLGLSLDPDGEVRAQNRGQYLLAPLMGQFSRLTPWLAAHRYALTDTLDNHLMLFGEWCAARHSLDYVALPDWFLLFDVYDRERQRFWSTPRRNQLAVSLGLAPVPEIALGRFTLAGLSNLLATHPSSFRQGPLEGIVIRRESADWCEARAKLVQADFTQSIGDHWRSRAIQWNLLGRPLAGAQ
ncbi:RNA ligase family protein [uncultured Thiodictyon sp.]|jgi:ATP-dependent RNA circularization protein (DNA/RNA ligase family)|uniref:RNA ligase family protein n=1 Tax=uncultured Thiodictyon sp. TaxID=1846217 RepID=UPI0025EC2347|nr:RNA ligase family protein [uncultured Thiodictyon sp.]